MKIMAERGLSHGSLKVEVRSNHRLPQSIEATYLGWILKDLPTVLTS